MAFLIVAAQAGVLCAREPGDRGALIREIINRSRLLEDAYFRLPRSVWQRFVVDEAKGAAPAPVSSIRSRGVYRLKTDGKGGAEIEAEIHLLVFDARLAGPIAVLPDSLAWSEITLAAAPIKPATRGKWLVFQSAEPGSYVIRARGELKGFKASGGTFTLPIIRTIQTAVTLDSPIALEVTASGAAGEARGKRVSLALKPASKLVLTYRPLQRRTARQAAYQVSGAIAWNFGPAAQQVSADLRVAILGGKSEGLEITLPPAAMRVAVTGPDVREIRTSGPAVSVFFRGAITGRTNRKLNYELPAARGLADLGRPEISNGRWSGGTLVITNTAGGSEIQPAAMSGLKEIALGDIPSSAGAILAGKAVLAYSITSPQWSAGAESINLGEFAIKQTIADSARYQFAYRPDGSVICRADYEIRNRNRQFLRITLPAGAKVLLARVSEKSRPMTLLPGRGKADEYLLPLERSTASVMGLVSFPVQVVYMYRADALKSSGRGAVALPRIDVPIAYAWCQANMPGGMSRASFSGVMSPVEQYSSQTALASMTYGSATAVDPKMKRLGRPETEKEPPPDKGGGGGGGFFGWGFFGGSKSASAENRMLGLGTTVTVPEGGTILIGGQIGSSSGSLYRNYWRAGQESYKQGKYDEADKALSKVIDMAPDSPDAPNAKRLLANIKLLKGKLKVKSRSEKAAAVAVKQQFSAANTIQLEQQGQLIEGGQIAIRKGDTKRAQQMFQAAEALGKKLVAKGENVVEQRARLREVRQQLDVAQKTSSDYLGSGLKQVKELRKSGRIAEAGALAEKLAKDVDELSNSGAEKITHEFQKEREELAFESAKATLKKNVRGTLGLDQKQKPGEGQGQAKTEGEDGSYRYRLRSGHKTKLLPDLPEIPNRRQSITGLRPGTDSFVNARRPDLAMDGRTRPAGQDLVRQRIDADQTGVAVSDTSGQTVQIYKVGDLVTELPGEGGKDGLENIAGSEAERNKRTDKLARQVQSLVKDGQVKVTLYNGQRAFQVISTHGGQRATASLIEGLRKARGPQVQIGSNLAIQEGLNQQTDDGFSYEITAASADRRHVTMTKRPKSGTYGLNVSDKKPEDVKVDPNLQDFILSNYAWQGRSSRSGRGTVAVDSGALVTKGTPDKLTAGRNLDPAELARKLQFNRGQKTQVASLNLNVDAAAVGSLGVKFHKGNNDVSYTIVDEAQFRTLMELDAATRSTVNGGQVGANETRQDTIIGTDALLANSMTTNVTHSRDRGNTLDISDNPISLSHEKYVLIDNNGYLTAVRAGEMQHWQEASKHVEFAAAPQTIEIPRVGELVKLEKTLVKPSDEMVVRFDYQWKGR